MAGIYIHIPFCKKACHYCDFHFSTQTKRKREMVDAICKELRLRKNFLDESVQTIYFGGGTPSLLNSLELSLILNEVYKNYTVESNTEITIECNPDDLDLEKIKSLKKIGFNRISLGVQSFCDHILKDLNRTHNTKNTVDSIHLLQNHGLDNISIDLIFGIPKLTDDMWVDSLERAILFNIPHISTYCLTVEPNTALKYFIKKEKYPNIDEESTIEQFKLAINILSNNGYTHYETSNFCQEGFISQHNSNYWTGASYLGIGPSAHSYNGEKRLFNLKNNILYINYINGNKVTFSSEKLSKKDHYNEYIMTRLRTVWGVSVSEISQKFGHDAVAIFNKRIQKHLNEKTIVKNNGRYILTEEGKLFTDSITSALFML